jgi:LysM domain-containing protein
MATASWDLGRPEGPGRALCPQDPRPAAFPLRPGEGPGTQRGRAAARRRITLLMMALGIGLLSTLPSALDVFGLSGPYDEREPAAEEGQEAPTIRAVVQPGDTIWDLAAPHVPEGVSLQEYVAEILLINDVDPGALQPGSVLDLPQPPSDPG